MIRQGRSLLVVALMVLTVGACASSGGTARTSYNRISAEEIAQMQGQVGNLLDLVNRLRPRWLEVRNAQGGFTEEEREVVVYQDQSLLGGVEMLRGLGLDMPLYLSYLDGAQAVAQLPGLGSRRIEGAIIVHTR